MEKFRAFIGTYQTNSTNWEKLIEVTIEGLGITYLNLSIDPDPNGRYRIFVPGVMSVDDKELLGMYVLLVGGTCH